MTAPGLVEREKVLAALPVHCESPCGHDVCKYLRVARSDIAKVPDAEVDVEAALVAYMRRDEGPRQDAVKTTWRSRCIDNTRAILAAGLKR